MFILIGEMKRDLKARQFPQHRVKYTISQVHCPKCFIQLRTTQMEKKNKLL